MAKKSTRQKKTTRRRAKSTGDDSLFNGKLGNGDGGNDASSSGGGGRIDGVALHEAAQSRYLNYSLSVITSRALPDVRDGLKPVQRRILYAMQLLRIGPDAKARKCAYVCGNVTGNYHPHGEGSVYDALVRMSQSWIMRVPLIDGQGNFGSIDNDPPAAMRYTECRQAPAAAPMLEDLATPTVAYRPNYDGTKEEPVVLPARLPNLLINGSAGIAVGMATSIPPHNPAEVCNALLKLLADPEIKLFQLVANDAIQGPDFPTAGQLITPREELREIYKNGQGSVKLRGTSKPGPATRTGKTLILDSIPYGVNKANLVEQIAEIVLSRKMAMITDVRDVSADDVRIELELRKDADDAKVLAYLYKHTHFQTNVAINLTCLVPTENPQVARPQPHCDLKTILWHFLHFRHGVVTKRLENELAALEKRLHILDGFALVFDALDEIIKIIRASDGKADAATKIMKRFKQLDEIQTEAILELKLYKLAKLEINLILDERKEKAKRARAIKKLLGDKSDDFSSGRWGIVKAEIEAIQEQLGTHAKDGRGKRLTKIANAAIVADEPEYNAEDFIIAEDCAVLVTADGWIKRQKAIADPMSSRIREGDAVLACVAGSTRATLGFFSSQGTCYTARFIDVPASTGYGEPIHKLFKLKDGERIVAVMSFDKRIIPASDLAEDPKKPELCPTTHGFAASSDGYALRFGLASFVEVSTRAGRKFGRPSKGQSIVGFTPVHGAEKILAISKKCRAMVCRSDEVNYLAGPGKGVQLIKLAKDDTLLGFKASGSDRDLLRYETGRGSEDTVSTAKYRVTGRGGRGVEVKKNGTISRIVPDDVVAPTLEPAT
ncbi:MAG: DNA topoisomerase (ATP-hydrolyzing) [Planctomycetota bacterium]